MTRGAPARAQGFTLIEMLGVLFLVSVVLSQAVGFYLDIARNGARATERIREQRRAVAILDRVADDLENAVLVVKPGPVDPLDHPWLFLAEAGSADGVTGLKFVARRGPARSSTSNASDLAFVMYGTREGEDGTLQLWRRVTPGLPDQLDRSIALDEEQGGQLLAEGLARFGMRFLSEEGEWKTSWDSSTLLDSSRLPVVAEVGLEMASQASPEPDTSDTDFPFIRQVILPLRPIDLEALLEPGALQAEEDDDDDDEQPDCVTTLGQCLNHNPTLRSAISLSDDQLDQLGGECVADLDLPQAVKDACP